MKYVFIKNGVVADVARVDPFGIFQEIYAAQFIEAPDEVEGGWLYDGETFAEPPPPEPVVPQEVTMGQCRLALFDIHKIKTEQEFLALTDLLPEDQRARARIELSTRPTVRFDNPLVQGVCAAKGWNAAELFIYAAAQ